MSHIKVELDFIPVEERLPKDDQGVFGFMDGYRTPQKLFFSLLEEEHWSWFSTGNPISSTVTYWAEIPKIGE